MKRKCWKDKSAAYFCLLSLFTVISCQLQLSPAETSSSSLPISLLNILHSFEEYNLFCIIMIPILFAVYHYIYRSVCPPNSLHSLTVTIPAVLFSLLMLVGNSFTQAGSLSMLKGFHNGQFIKVCIKFTGSYIFFSFMIAFLYHALDKYRANYCSHQPGIKLLHHYISIINRYPFRTTFITLTLIYIPYIIVSYPANIMGDAYAQMLQAYPELGIITPSYLNGRLLSDTVYLSSHHPIVHTLLMHAFLQIGATFFHSYNIGIFLFALLQFFFLLTAVSFAVKLLITQTVMPPGFIVCVVLYYIISPRIQSYMFLITKDVIYSTFFLYFIIFLYLNMKMPCLKHHILLILSGFGMILFRNEAKYILLLSLPVIAILQPTCKKFIIKYCVAIVLFCLLFFRLLLPICHVNPGSIREMLSVPFQQTARCVKEHENEITLEEKEAIASVLDYSSIGKNYNPDRSDAVKDTFQENCSREDLVHYFKIWFRMFLKYPGSYFQATIGNYYSYFYPGGKLFNDFSYEGSALCMEIMNEKMKPLGTDFHYPSTPPPSTKYGSFIMNYVKKQPPHRFFLS